MPISECTLCGKNADKLFLAEVEGSRIEVCASCGKYGNIIEEIIPKQKIERVFIKKEVPELEDYEELKPKYGQLIMQARQKLGLERKQFSMKINERESVMKRVESQQMIPDDKLQRKIENFLGIKLTESYEKKKLSERSDKGKLTLGDIVKID